jgi:hypothetical protein
MMSSYRATGGEFLVAGVSLGTFPFTDPELLLPPPPPSPQLERSRKVVNCTDEQMLRKPFEFLLAGTLPILDAPPGVFIHIQKVYLTSFLNKNNSIGIEMVYLFGCSMSAWQVVETCE